MDLKGKKVFISGGAGVIGTVMVEKLHKEGAVILVGDLKPRPKNLPKSILYRQGDLNYITKEELLNFEPEYFFHLAATFERSEETYEFWAENYQHNVKLSNHLMSCLKDSQTLKKVVFASSYLIYKPELYSFDRPAKAGASLKETDSICPRNICGAAKLLHEIELRFLSNYVQFDTVCARIYRSYGKNSRDIISRWIRMLLKGEIITVYKKEGMFDYIYAEQVAEGLIRLMESPATGIVNLGNGRARRVEEILEILKKHFPQMKSECKHIDIPYEASQADMSKFKELTGWIPEKQLEDAIPEIIEFEKNTGFLEDKNVNFNILITSVSAKVPLVKAVKKASLKLGNIGKIYGADLNSDCIGKYFVDAFWQMPRLDELGISGLIDYCKKNKISSIIPTRDGELEFFAKYKDDFLKKNISIMISDLECVEKCIDKLLFYKYAKTLNLPVIQTVTNIRDLSYSKFVVKEQFGAGSKKIGLNLNKEEALAHAKTLENPIFQPFVKGEEYSVDLYIDQKNTIKGAVARKRDVVVNGESQITTTVRDAKLEKLCSDFAKKFGFYGHVIFQALLDIYGEYHIIECNCRFGGASQLSLEAGLDSFYWFLLETLGEDISKYPFIHSNTNKKLIRYAEDLIV